MGELKRTPLYPEYEKYNGKLIEFFGWELPVQFAGIMREHRSTRSEAGLFDVSHMGKIVVSGLESVAFLDHLVTNNISKLVTNKVQYSFMCNDDGGTIDDLLIYMIDDKEYLLVVNASNAKKDLVWLQQHAQDYRSVKIDDKSNDYAILALQGPKAEKIIQKITDINVSVLKMFSFYNHVNIIGLQQTTLISRTGYTGEDGFEILVQKSASRNLWNILLEAGEEYGLAPAGLGARDTLRFEAGLPLYGQELSEDISPIEAGLSFAVKTEKQSDFIGKTALKNQLNKGMHQKIVGIEMVERGIPRIGYEIVNKEHKKIGRITSGTHSPTLKKSLGLALIERPYNEIGTEVWVNIRNHILKAKVIKTPFYKRN